MSAASIKFVERLRVVYGDPVSENTEQFMFEYARMLNNYTEAELEEAADLLFQRHKGPHRWPRIPECIMCAEEARERRHSDAKAKEANKPQNPDWMPEVVAMANDLIRCDLGRRAAREGWITQLWDFCRKHRRLPDKAEIERARPLDPRRFGGLIAEARRFDQAYAECCKPDAPEMTRKLKELGDSMLERRDRLSAIADPTLRNPAGSDA